jgi:hypothetical protein
MAMWRVVFPIAFAFLPVLYAGEEPGPSLSADEIMRRVGTNQDTAQTERNGVVYDQKIRVVSRGKDGKLICRQDTEYTVIPKDKKTERKLVSTSGECWKKGELIHFDKDPEDSNGTIDTGIVKMFRDDVTHTDSKDGVSEDLFPLTTEHQQKLEFLLDGERDVQGRPAYIIRFRPKDRKDFGWAGEAIIDKEEFQPVRVYTQMARKLPFVVRNMLGTDVPGLGFTTSYTRVGPNLWFPSSFGTEFKIHAVYFFHRTVTMSLENKNFRHTDVQTAIKYDPAMTGSSEQ